MFFMGNITKYYRNNRRNAEINENGYPQSSYSVRPMFEISLIGTSAKFKPLKKAESETPSIELVTELVEV